MLRAVNSHVSVRYKLAFINFEESNISSYQYYKLSMLRLFEPALCCKYAEILLMKNRLQYQSLGGFLFPF